MQVIYGILAMMLLGIFSLSMSRGIQDAQRKMIDNEVATQFTGVGVDLLEYIGGMAFDENLDESKVVLAYPVTVAPTGSAAFGGCGTSLQWVDPTCDDIDDFDGATVTRTAGGFVYTVTIAVRYVDPLTLQPVATSYAKEVQLTLSNAYLKVGGQPLQVRLSRVFAYNRHT